MKYLVVILCAWFVLSCNTDNAGDEWINADKHPVKKSKGVVYVDGKAFTGLLFSLYSHGDTAYVKTYMHGKLNGPAKIWYSSGQLKAQYHYKDNIFNGNVKEWFPNGRLYRSFNYIDGQEDGMQTMYWDNGKIRANYQSKNGRKYGLTGIKNCSSPWSDSLKQLLVAGM